MKRLLLIVCLFFMRTFFYSQSCNSCIYNITGIDNLSYTVSAGQCLSIDSTAIVSGTIMLNGGTICNRGFVKLSSLIYNSGTINNYSNITLNSSINIPANSSVFLFNSGVVNVEGNLINNGSIINSGFINITGNIQNIGTLINNNIINCSHLTGNAITNNGLINSN